MLTSGIDVHEHTLIVRKEIVTIYNITRRRGCRGEAESRNLHVPKRGTQDTTIDDRWKIDTSTDNDLRPDIVHSVSVISRI